MDRSANTKGAVHAELERARGQFHSLLEHAQPDELRWPTNGTRWTNEQLLFHMVLGYGVVRVLLPLVRIMSRLPGPVSRGFAATLNAGARPFHLVNYLGPCAAVRVVNRRRLGALIDATVASLHRRLDAETEKTLQLRMHFPERWDPFFADTMTVHDVYHYATVHFDFHREQLTLRCPG